jgi:hypothetical protein
VADAAPLFTKLAVIGNAVGFACAEFFLKVGKKNIENTSKKFLFTP